MAVVGEEESVPRLDKEVNKVCVVTRGDVSQTGVRSVDIGGYSGLEKGSQRRSVIRQRFGGTSEAMAMVVVLAVPGVLTREPGRRHRAPPQDV